MHIISGKAVCFGEALQPDFKEYSKKVVENAQALAKGLISREFRLVSGGTDNHLILVDLTPMDIDGRDAELAMEKVGISANKNAIPNDPKPPRVASGLRLGTPAITSRGFKEEDSKQVADLIVRVLTNMGDEQVENTVREEIKELTARFPVPGLDT